MKKIEISIVGRWLPSTLFLLTVLALLLDVPGPGPDRGTALLAANLFASLFAGCFLSLKNFFQAVAQFLPCEEAIHLTGSLPLDFDFLMGGRVLEKDAGRGLVDLLPTAAGAADKFFDEVIFENSEGIHAPFERLFFIGREHRDILSQLW
jgi:hypothetical protein